MKNNYTAGFGALLACMGLGLLIVGLTHFLGIESGSSSLAEESWIGMNLPTVGLGLGLLVLGFFLMSTFRKTTRTS